MNLVPLTSGPLTDLAWARVHADRHNQHDAAHCPVMVYRERESGQLHAGVLVKARTSMIDSNASGEHQVERPYALVVQGWGGIIAFDLYVGRGTACGVEVELVKVDADNVHEIYAQLRTQRERSATKLLRERNAFGLVELPMPAA